MIRKLLLICFFTITLTIFDDYFRSLGTTAPFPHKINRTKGRLYASYHFPLKFRGKIACKKGKETRATTRHFHGLCACSDRSLLSTNQRKSEKNPLSIFLFCDANLNFPFWQFKASNPVPPDGSTEVKAASRNVLMWLNSFGGRAHVLYLGTSPNALKQQGVARGERNVVKLRKPLESGKEYFWRVDTRINNKVTYKGDVWSFKTI